MPLGSPAITKPRALELRPMQEAVDAIRQRLLACDTEIIRLQQIANASTAATLAASLSAAVRSLTLRVTALESALGVTDTIVIAAGENVAIYDPVVMVSSTACGPADPSDPTRITAVIGIATVAGVVGQPITIQRRGVLSLPSGAFEAGRPVYVGLAGGLTQDPSYADFVVPVGVATSSTALWVAPGEPALLTPGLYGSGYDDWMPATWGLLRQRMQQIDALFEQPDGFVVKTGDVLATRVLQAGSGTGLDITNPDGVDGDPMFMVDP